MNELVSIIIPVYNAEKFIEKTIDSVRNQKEKLKSLYLLKIQFHAIKQIEDVMEVQDYEHGSIMLKKVL